MEINVAVLPQDGNKIMYDSYRNEVAFYCNAVTAVSPAAKNLSATSFASRSHDNETSSTSFDVQELSVMHVR